MKRSQRLSATYLLALLLCACAAAPVGPATTIADELAVWMTGTFSSEAQHQQRPDDYLSIRMVMLPIWTNRDDGPWLYVEQAANSALARPYRQRVYHLVATGPDSARSDVYSLPKSQETQCIAAWRQAEPLAKFAPSDLLPRTGCSIHLRRDGEARFAGATEGDGCQNSWSGASFARAKVTVTPVQLTSWDQGYDADGNKVWGAEHGPYAFDKVGSPTPD